MYLVLCWFKAFSPRRRSRRSENVFATSVYFTNEENIVFLSFWSFVCEVLVMIVDAGRRGLNKNSVEFSE